MTRSARQVTFRARMLARILAGKLRADRWHGIFPTERLKVSGARPMRVVQSDGAARGGLKFPGAAPISLVEGKGDTMATSTSTDRTILNLLLGARDARLAELASQEWRTGKDWQTDPRRAYGLTARRIEHETKLTPGQTRGALKRLTLCGLVAESSERRGRYGAEFAAQSEVERAADVRETVRRGELLKEHGSAEAYRDGILARIAAHRATLTKLDALARETRGVIALERIAGTLPRYGVDERGLLDEGGD